MAARHPPARAGCTGLAAAAVALALGGCTAASARQTPVAKLGGHLLQDARRADVLGLTPTALLSSGPPRAGNVARVLSESELGRGRVEGGGGDRDASRGTRSQAAPRGGWLRGGSGEADREWFAGLLERQGEVIDDTWDETERDETYVEPLEDPRLRYLVLDGPVSFYNEQGREFHEGSNLFVSDRAVARVWRRFVVTAEPELSFAENRDRAGRESGVAVRMLELAASGRLGPVELTVGKQSLWWGPGRHGTLLLSNTARPLNLLKVSTAEPQLLPGWLAYLGLLDAQLFVSLLEESRAVPRPVLAGGRVSTRLNPYLELGVSRVAQFGGKGREVDFGTLVDVVTARTENEPDDPGNQIASIDARVIVPWPVQPFELYGEIGGEDEANLFFSQEAVMAGVYLPRVGPWGWLELTFEYANMTFGTTRGRVWYTNGNFPDGYTYHERVLGHHVGTDGQDYFFEVGLRFFEDRLRVRLSYDLEEHERRDPAPEEVDQYRVQVEAAAWEGVWVWLFYAQDRWENFGARRGKEETGHAVGLGLRWEW